jgi:alginate O-acetyltransferase complex protein AlgI
MVFSSLLFLYAFLPLFLTAYYLTPARHRNAVALTASIVFYAWGEPVFVLVLGGVSVLVYGVSRKLGSLPETATRARRFWLTLGLVIAVGLLVICKYTNFFFEQLNGVLGWLQHGSVVWTKVALPIGVSFFTFQKVSYLVDVYRGTARPARSLQDFLLFVALFPQLIAGPIVRYHDIAGQIVDREYRVDRFLSGLWRFLLGLGRKVLFANQLGFVADKIFAHEAATLPMTYAWMGLLCYTFQIYFDFAGYSDMAIGLGRMMGFELLENFNRPYTARSITEFWHRWHISLTNFMRDYLYIPLGGNRRGRARTVWNLWLVFLASGFWHGASWNFVAWGAYHGSLLSLERLIGRARIDRVPALLGRLGTMVAVMLGWVLFRSGNFSYAGSFLQRLYAWKSWGVPPTDFNFLWPEVVSRRSIAVLLLAALISFVPDRFWQRWGWDDALPAGRAAGVLRTGIAATCLVFATAALASQSYNPFIYFRF